MDKFKRHIIKLTSIFCFTMLLMSCENDLDAIKKITHDPKAPDEVIENFKLFYTDSGFAQIEVFAKIAETYSKPEVLTKFKDGLIVNFYSQDGKISSTLTAKYGEFNPTKMMVFVKDSVVLKNLDRKQQLETEALFWNQKDSSIYTESSAIVRSEKGIFYGDGIRTKQDFSYYEFLKPHGKISLE